MKQHHQSESLNLIAAHCPDIGPCSVAFFGHVLKHHVLRPWHFDLKTGDYCVVIVEADDGDPSLEYAEVVDSKDSDFEGLEPGQQALCISTALFDDVTKLGGPQGGLPLWEASAPLTGEQFHWLRTHGFPSRLDDFLVTMAEFHTQAVVPAA